MASEIKKKMVATTPQQRNIVALKPPSEDVSHKSGCC